MDIMRELKFQGLLKKTIAKPVVLLLLAVTSCNLFYCTNRAEMLRQVENKKNKTAFKWMYKSLFPQEIRLYCDISRKIAVGIYPEVPVDNTDALYETVAECADSLQFIRRPGKRTNRSSAFARCRE